MLLAKRKACAVQIASVNKSTHILYFKNQMTSNYFEHINARMHAITALRRCAVSIFKTGIYLQKLVLVTLRLMTTCIPYPYSITVVFLQFRLIFSPVSLIQ